MFRHGGGHGLRPLTITGPIGWAAQAVVAQAVAVVLQAIDHIVVLILITKEAIMPDHGAGLSGEQMEGRGTM